MPCTVRVVGSSGSGKTTFVEGVLPVLADAACGSAR